MTSEESNAWLKIMIKNAIPVPERLKTREELEEEIQVCYTNIKKGLLEMLSNNTPVEDGVMCGGISKYQTLFRRARRMKYSRQGQKEFLIYLRGYLHGVGDWERDNETKASREFITDEIFKAEQLMDNFENYDEYQERIKRQEEEYEKWNAYTPEEHEKMIMDAVRRVWNK